MSKEQFIHIDEPVKVIVEDHKKANRIKYLREYITGWEYKYPSKAPAAMYEELEMLQADDEK